MIREFLLSNDLYDHNWPGARCEQCDKPCKNAHGVKTHKQYCYFNTVVCDRPAQSFHHRKAEAAAKTQKRKDAQASRPEVQCEGKSLENIFLFKYLGSVFAADGSQEHDISRRIALAMSRCGQLRNIFSSEQIPLNLKISIYKTAVSSLLTYGSEAWSLTPKAQARINGANARCLSRLTGRTAHQEASSTSQTYDLVTAIRQRRWKWLGHILRTPGDRLTKTALRVQFTKGNRFNLLQDVPQSVRTFEELTAIAQNRKRWRSLQPKRNTTKTRSASTTTNIRYSLLSNTNSRNNSDTTTQADATTSNNTTTQTKRAKQQQKELPLFPIFGGPPLKTKPKVTKTKKPKKKARTHTKAESGMGTRAFHHTSRFGSRRRTLPETLKQR